jgi:hypothetical protein
VNLRTVKPLRDERVDGAGDSAIARLRLGGELAKAQRSEQNASHDQKRADEDTQIKEGRLCSRFLFHSI